MAENIELMTLNPRYFCYVCHVEVSVLQPAELICPNCLGGFLEEVSENLNREEIDDEDLSDTENAETGLSLLSLSRFAGRLVDGMRELGYESDDELDETDADSEEQPEANDSILSVRTIIENLQLEHLEEQLLRQYQDLNLSSTFNVFLNDDIDAISTMILNEPDVSGPPPLPKEQIKQLATTTVTPKMIAKKVQCTVCMEDFHVREKVKSLPCEHCFHEKCITPWLEMHATCPNCRKIIEIPELKSSRSQSLPRSESISRSQSWPRSESTSSRSRRNDIIHN